MSNFTKIMPLVAEVAFMRGIKYEANAKKQWEKKSDRKSVKSKSKAPLVHPFYHHKIHTDLKTP